MIQKHRFNLGKKVLSGVTAFALASSMAVVPATAFAAGETAKAVTGYVTASVTPASQSATEILGITNVDELQLDPATVDININNENARQNYLKYILMGTDEWNKVPNPYYFNTVYKINGATQVVNNKDKRRSSGTGKDGSFMPNRALAPYKSGDATDDLVWDQLPDIVIGIGVTDGTIDYSGSDYARAVEKAHSLSANSYNPVGIAYNVETLATIVDKVYDMAKAGDQIASKSSGAKKLRYGNATAIAKQYEKYVKGIQGYILKALDIKKAKKKSVVVLTDIAADAVTVQQTPSDWSAGGGNRFLEITTLVANNYADKLKTTDETNKTAQMSMADLKAAVNKGDIDLVIVNDGQADKLSFLSGLEGKAYWGKTDTGQNSTGAIYKVNANAPEIATNYGRILGCLYPEYVDQSDLVAYYYDKFYHVKDNKLAEAIDKCMDGIRNWDAQSGQGDALVQWSTSTVANYNAANVQNLLNEGASYARDLSAKNPTAYALIKPTSNLTAADFAFTTTFAPAKGEKYTSGSLKYQITNASTNGTGTVKIYAGAKSASKQTGKVTVPATVKIQGKSYKVTEIGSKAFANYKKITSVTVGKNVKTIGTSAFQGCAKLGSVTLGAAVTTIKSKAFYNAKNLKTIKITSKKLKSVGSSAIKSISSKAKIKVPSAKLKAYKKIFKKSTGFKKTMKISK